MGRASPGGRFEPSAGDRLVLVQARAGARARHARPQGSAGRHFVSCSQTEMAGKVERRQAFHEGRGDHGNPFDEGSRGPASEVRA